MKAVVYPGSARGMPEKIEIIGKQECEFVSDNNTRRETAVPAMILVIALCPKSSVFSVHISEVKQRRRRQRERRLVKNELIFFKRNSRSPRYANGSKTVLKLTD